MKLGTSIKRIVSVDPEEYRVALEYDDGFRGTVYLGFLFGAPKGKPLVTEIVRGCLFEKCFIDSGALAWPNGYELCPDVIRYWISERTNKKVA